MQYAGWPLVNLLEGEFSATCHPRWLESANGRVSERGLKGGTWDEHSANRATLLQGWHDFFKTLSIGGQRLHYLVMEQWPVIRLKPINPQHLC